MTGDPIRDIASEPDSDARCLESTILEVVGNRGYANTTVQDVLDASGIRRSDFYRQFTSKANCFLMAHANAKQRICDELLAECAVERDWRKGCRRALRRLLALAMRETALAKALFVEFRAAPEPVFVVHREVTDRIATAIDAAKLHPAARAPVPDWVASMLVGLIEESLGAALAADDLSDIERLASTWSYLVVLNYFGEEDAERELEHSG